ncbi:MAG: hypothetical protein ACRD96_23025, partial [Bryobacteraceae bacterium]
MSTSQKLPEPRHPLVETFPNRRTLGAFAFVSVLLAFATLRAIAQASGAPGDPLPGVTPREFEEFRLGLEDFREIEESSEGLGPLFNGTGCASCHSVP